ncbi:MAG: S9 family peptidase [Bdellovibrio sp. CG10_big_fil_rev_8_21_14_0_10_47_8]|nr:MAG: S9 family peptidase [Bdellovibrio sp. CG10_big_fil_rev_8_21_14_0_10_47_8]
MLDIRSPGLGMLSAKKNNLYFSWRVTGTSQVWKLQNPKGFPQQMTGGEDSTSLEGLTADDQWLILSRDRNGEENPGLYLQKTSGGPLKVIQHKTKVQTFFEFVSDDSKWIYYRSNDVKPDSFALYRYGIETGKSELLFSQDGYWVVADYRDDGRLLMAKVLSNFASEYYEFNPASKELKPVIGQGEKEDYTVQYGAADGTYLVLTPKLGEFKRLYSWDGKKLSPVTPNLKWNVAGFSIDHHRTKLTYEVNEGGYSKVHALDARTLKPISFPRFPNADNVYVGSFSKDGKMIMVGVETASAPRTSYSYSFESGVLTQWALPSAPEVDLKTFAKASLENYVTRDGVKIPMFVRRPPQCMDKKRATPCPVVVHFHGGPEAQTTAGFSVFAQMFIDEGVVFVEPNVRGSDGYGKTWLHSDDGAERLKVITDIEDASIFIKKNWAIQGVAPKVGVMGWSYGGYSTLMAMTQFAGAYDAGVSLVGMSNLVTFLNNTAPYRRQLRTPEYGDPEKDKEALIQLSPITYLDRVRAPLMIIQGATDPRVPAGEAIQMHKALKSKGIESPLIIFADEGHGAGKRSNKVLELGHALAFLKKNLK